MDTIVAIIKDNIVINAISFVHDPSNEEITQFVELLGGTSGQKLAEKEIINDGQIIEKPKPFPSWVWNSEIKNYETPVAKPLEGIFVWDEATLAWVEPE
jgi:hypothetical protein